MTYFENIIKASLNLYFKLKKENIHGRKLENIITDTFSISISTFYNWLNKYNNDDNNNDKNDDNDVTKLKKNK